ncbi:hypothetical protein ABIB68_007181 [Bradyrhizobium sp. F1.2.2]
MWFVAAKGRYLTRVRPSAVVRVDRSLAALGQPDCVARNGVEDYVELGCKRLEAERAPPRCSSVLPQLPAGVNRLAHDTCGTE